MKEREEIIEARRARLRDWIALHYGGKGVAFRKDVKINQGELSGLMNGDKPFAEAKAMKLEAQTQKSPHKMPEGYLLRPLDEHSAPTAGLPDAGGTLIGDVLFLRTVLNTVIAALARSIPDAGEKMLASLEQVDGHDKKYLGEVTDL